MRINKKGKLKVLAPFIDFKLNVMDATRALMPKVQELKIRTTEKSIYQFIRNERFKKYGNEGRTNKILRKRVFQKYEKSPVTTVEIFSNAVEELIDLRAFILATVEENATLRIRIDEMRKALNG
jgi:hypothetical protein